MGDSVGSAELPSVQLLCTSMVAAYMTARAGSGDQAVEGRSALLFSASCAYTPKGNRPCSSLAVVWVLVVAVHLKIVCVVRLHSVSHNRGWFAMCKSSSSTRTVAFPEGPLPADARNRT